MQDLEISRSFTPHSKISSRKPGAACRSMTRKCWPLWQTRVVCSDLGLLQTSTRFRTSLRAVFSGQRAISPLLLPCNVESPQRKVSRHLRSKDSSAIGQIVKSVVCAVDLDAGTVTAADGQAPLTTEEQERILGTTKEARARDWDLTSGHRFHLCDTSQSTDFPRHRLRHQGAPGLRT